LMALGWVWEGDAWTVGIPDSSGAFGFNTLPPDGGVRVQHSTPNTSGVAIALRYPQTNKFRVEVLKK
jgi:hypothetical protein